MLRPADNSQAEHGKRRLYNGLRAPIYPTYFRDTTLVVLTGFEEFRFYDASIQPDARKPGEGLLLKLRDTNYIESLEKLWEFSTRSVTQGD